MPVKGSECKGYFVCGRPLAIGIIFAGYLAVLLKFIWEVFYSFENVSIKASKDSEADGFADDNCWIIQVLLEIIKMDTVWTKAECISPILFLKTYNTIFVEDEELNNALSIIFVVFMTQSIFLLIDWVTDY